MMSLNFCSAEITLASEADLPALAELDRLCNSHPWTEQDFRQALQQGYLGLLARESERIVGFAVARLLLDEAELLLIGTHPEARRQGVGRLLLSECLLRLKASGAQCLHLEVRVSNVGAQAFYRALGFQDVGRRRGYYPAGRHGGDREDALLMRIAIL